MDSDMIMSATANTAVGESIAQAEYWRAFALAPGKVMGRIAKVVEKPDLSIKSEKLAGVELRAQFDGRLGVAGVIDGGQVKVAFPFAKDGRRMEIKVSEVVSGSGGREGWIVGESEGTTLRFYDLLHSTGRSRYATGETHEFIVNALALSLRRVQPLPVSTDPDDGDVLLRSLCGIRMYVPQKAGNGDTGSLQSPIDGPPKTLTYEEHEFHCLPVSLSDGGDGKRPTTDLLAVSTITEELGPSFDLGDELAGVVWLQGYSPDHLDR